MPGAEQQGFAAAYGRWVVRWRWPVIVLSILVVLACGAGAPRITISDNYRVFFDKHNPMLKALDAFENTYVREENTVFVLAPRDGDVFTRDTLQAIHDLTEEMWQIPYTLRVDSITNFQHTYAAGEDDLVVEDLVEDPAALTDADLARVREVALNEPLLVNRMISPDGHATMVYAVQQLPGKAGGERAPAIARLRQIAAEFQNKHPDIRLAQQGSLVLSHSFSEHTAKDGATLFPLMYGIILLLIPIALRSVASSVAAATTILLSVIAATGLAGWSGLLFTATASAMPHMVMTLAVADCIHVLVLVVSEQRKGLSKQDAIAEAIRVSLFPVFLTTFTTAIGLLSLNFSPVPPTRDFGNMTTMGVIAAFVLAVGYLPALMAVLPSRIKERTVEAPRHNRLGPFVLRHRRGLLAAGVLVTLGLGALLPLNDFNNNWIEWFHESTQFRKDTQFMRENLSGSNTVEFSIGADGPSGISDPAYLRKLDEFANWLRARPEVHHVTNIADIMKRLNKNMHGDDPDYYCVPSDRELAAQFLLLYEMSLPPGFDLNTQINLDKSASRLTIVTDNLDSISLNHARHEYEQWLRDNAPEYMHAEATSNSVMFASIAENTIRSLVISVPAALVVVSFTLIFAFRSVKFGLLSLIPNLVPLIMAYGLWGVVEGHINFGLAAVAGLTIGIVVDDTVHFMAKYIRARREFGKSPEEAVLYAFDVVGRAMVITSVVLVAGFLMLTLSVFQFNANMGQLAAITIAFALVADLFFLPPILMLFDKDKESLPA